ncbi:aminotransferase [Mesorhizobium hungaricum]|jgi:dTDP-4-amino-4,6-dideoxygalactose transaminase|uniref:Aminotransferase n=1 Tax=Mesorhizobium hungaricum TaxID=1566387 RepID=A0A1C2E775_9HYPH|nr:MULTISPECIES: DegT/DnrJ/EryC1/StrS family aminotransferase [Mesorhizobium]MBN9237314.1 DegT/DnrJ/EryC1/StrS family aminotransferase [Mesorhizobium sp.]MDQ0333240.1 dTDP-4-amino-4,6-dideoxygalactose transaminase [Mesorhizobium sp. YL-MeA3-2017]OCX22839.1 aminotransferase [Mesorhizobium hungaricum]
MARQRFTGSFTQQLPIPDEGITAAAAVMRSGRLHRYNIAGGDESEAMALEREYAAWQGARFCLAVASGGQAMQIALRAAGVRAGETVLTNAFTLAPVPGAIAAVGAKPVFVETTEDLVIDLDDLSSKAKRTGARYLLLSHMRGHMCDMEALLAVATEIDLTVIEDCAHTMGATWNGRRSGSFGLAGCFSTQTYKHLNSGEGGLLTSDDAEFIARATILSGSYMLYERHGAGPNPDTYTNIRLDTPNMSARMDNLRAALLRPQLQGIEQAICAWNARHDLLAARLAANPEIRIPHRPAAERYVGSSIQFMIPVISAKSARVLLRLLADMGVEVKWFGAKAPAGFTSDHHSWRYAGAQDLPRTDAILASLFDMRLPLTFSLDDCELIADHILDAVTAVAPKVEA